MKKFIEHFTDPLEYWRLKWVLLMVFYLVMFLIILRW